MTNKGHIVERIGEINMDTNVTYTPIYNFNDEIFQVKKYSNVRIKARWPKTRFVEKSVHFLEEAEYIPVGYDAFVVENYHVFVKMGNNTYRINNIRYSSDIYDFIEKRQKEYLAQCKKMASGMKKIFYRKKLQSFSLYYRGKLLSRAQIELSEFNIPNGTVLDIQMHLLMGGSQENILLPTYSHVKECEAAVLNEFVVQSITEDFALEQGLNFLRSFFPSGENGAYCVKLLEDVLLLINGIVRSRSKADYTIALVTFVKLRMDGPLFCSRTLSQITEKFHSLFDNFEVQSVEETFSTMRDYLSYYERVKESPMFAKLYKFSMYALSLSLFEKLGVTFDTFKYSKIEEEAIRRKYHMGSDFVHTLLDTVLFLCERGYQCMVTGSLDPLYHCGSSYQAWFDEAMRLKRTAAQLSFPEAHGIDRHKYLADLRDHIEKGMSIYKHAARLSNYDKKCVGGVLSDLNMLLDNEITKREAQKERDAPFSVLIYGGSSIGKSTLTSMLFSHYGKVFGLQTGSEYKYTRNANDEFWSGFNSSQWCVQLDDIAFMHPNKASEGDKSVMEMLQVVNNVPFIPAQADLADKGRTPMRAKLVLATTNCEDLNAYFYFQTPLAVRRRLPFVIDVTTKEEFTKDGCMLDNSRTETVSGEYCDYWNYKIYRIVPDGDKRERQRAKKEFVCEFTDVNEFLAWFAREAKNHERVQNLVRESGNNMDNIVVCQSCFFNSTRCQCAMQVQATDVGGDGAIAELEEPATWWETVKYQFMVYLLWFLYSDAFCWVVRSYISTAWFQRWLERRIVAPEERMKVLRPYFYALGGRVNRTMATYKVAAGIIMVVAQAIIAYKASQKMTKWMIDLFAAPQFDAQGNNLSSEIGRAPEVAEDERQNVWHKDDFELTTFDVSEETSSRSMMKHEDVCQLVGKNTVFFSTTCQSRTRPKVIRATCLGGHIYVCNSHGLPRDEILNITLITSPVEAGITRNISFVIAQKEVFRIPNSDLAFVQVLNVPPRKNISGLLPKNVLGGMFKGTYVGTTAEGLAFRKRIDAIRPFDFDIHTDGVEFTGKGWLGTVREPTVNGDCGSMLVAESGRGPILLGIHFVGDTRGCTAGSVPLIEEHYTKAVEFFARPVVESSTPQLDAPSVTTKLGDLHNKSVFRFLEDGSANVYGSFTGFRAAPKSRVVPTVISDAVEARGYSVKHGKPVMRGWQPWRIAALEMVKPVTRMNPVVLKECVECYTEDILAALSQDDLAEIMVYDDITTLNGAPGVAYVDKMNRNTSAGFPWRKTKKAFLEPIAPIGNLSEPVEATPEIMDRVQKVIEGYQAGRRYMPVFTGHLKDEATKFSKIEAKKTRVFTGAPFDWSFVVRKYLLSFVRVLQKNRFVFEAAPGTNAQSLEWHEIRNYLTKFGEDTMVAGDYAAFDKSMPPCMILAAFDIIRSVSKAAGMSEEELRVIQGIAEDTAFPVVDFNGDLVEFYGSNPSGHPLTVIVNSLANSLYMRYCYAELNPMKTAKTFKRDVALMTYGDDNVMGVNSSCTFFHHTAIQEVLAGVGIKYTMADKEAESVPYIHIDNVSFLKRLWRWDADVGAFLAPLEEASIGKSLTRVVASKTVPAEKQAVDVMSSACREYFFYGKEIFHKKRQMFLDIVAECELEAYVEASSFPSWEELADNFIANSKHVTL